MRQLACFLAAFVTFSFAADVLADPPPWAPAHGYHKKKGKKQEYYVGYSGREYAQDLDIPGGHCNREEAGAIVGGVIGGAVGNQVSDRDNRVIGTILGATVGAILGAEIGRSMDEDDHACFGHAMEIGSSGRTVAWVNPTNNWRYQLMPGNGVKKGNKKCRSFTLAVVGSRNPAKQSGVACLVKPGVWELLGG